MNCIFLNYIEKVKKKLDATPEYIKIASVHSNVQRLSSKGDIYRNRLALVLIYKPERLLASAVGIPLLV